MATTEILGIARPRSFRPVAPPLADNPVHARPGDRIREMFRLVGKVAAPSPSPNSMMPSEPRSTMA
ncbi:hypothetical protein [Streptomyces shenzhenensis]|uniref:hypothetical protein n=1 Tax=Streptomyces shenzhenensis TaxID=943815 RepID=UPI001F3CFD9B|nr:hypothetical protein [Streptomyces shenzhenensis]